jgi:hypothetical protein
VGTVRIRVTNCSAHPWPATGREGWFQVCAGNHWVAEDGTVLVADDGRAFLPHDVAPGASCDVTLSITAPARAKRARLEVDLVQEGVTWFADRGSRKAEADVVVRNSLRDRFRDSRRPSHPGSGADGGMEMHGMPEAMVAEWASAAGGRLVASFDWDEVQVPFAPDWVRRGLILTR